MMSPVRLCGAIGLLFATLLNVEPVESAELPTGPAAPPQKCEIRQSAWCIYQGAWEIIRRFDEKKTGDVVWILSDSSRPDSQLVVFEPYGCREGLANTVAALGFDEDVEWQRKPWDQMRVRLKTDGSCDLRMLVPLFNNDPLEWAFSVGRGLIRACKDEKCTGTAPTLADVTDKYRKQFKREKEKAN